MSSTAPTMLSSPPPEAFPLPELRPGQIVGGYKVLRLIGEGGLSRVYQVRPKEGGADMALKLPLAAAPPRRPRPLALPTPHPNVVSVYGQLEALGRPGILMEYVEGETVAALMEEGRLYEGGEGAAAAGIVNMMLQAARGLAHIHSQGLAHCDVKPANMLLETGGRLVLTDFGEEDFSLGTCEYFSPERAEKRESGVFPDLWALALCVVECFLGRRPWASGSIVRYALDAYRAEQWAVPPSEGLWDFFHKALAHDISARYPSAAAMGEALMALERGGAYSLGGLK